VRRAHRASAFGTVALAATVGACGGPRPPGGSDHPGDIGVVNGGGAIEDLEGGGHIEGPPGGPVPVHDGSATDSDGATSSESGSTGSVDSPGGGTNLGGNGTGDAGGAASSGSGSTGSNGSGAAGGYQGGNSVAAPGAFGDGGVGGLVLTIAGNVNLTSLDWTIQGMVTYRGSIAVDGAETIDGDKRIVWLVAVQAGDGYAVAVSATDTNGDRCVGSSAPLNVEAGMVTNAFVTVTCGRAASLEAGDGAVAASD
jgi:hypothetical protein